MGYLLNKVIKILSCTEGYPENKVMKVRSFTAVLRVERGINILSHFLNMSSDDSDHEELPKRLNLNDRQLVSELNYKSFQSVWKNSAYRPTRRGPNGGEPDPVPMPRPGRNNINCLYDVNDITIKYRIEKDVDTQDVIRVLDGRQYSIRRPRHVKWKWLEFYAHNVMSNRVFRYFTCPYGCFEIQDHRLEKVYFPTRRRPKFAADFSCKIKVRGAYYEVVDSFDDRVIHNKLDELNQGNRINYQYGYFRAGIPAGVKDIKFANIKDTWRYCFAFEYVLNRQDRRHGLTEEEFISASDMWFRCVDNLFDFFKQEFRLETMNLNRRRENDDMNFYMYPRSLKSNFYIKYKDIPSYEYMQTFNLKRGHFEDDEPDADVIVFR